MLVYLLVATTVVVAEKDIGDFVGSTKWWNSNVDIEDFAVLAQDPNYRCEGTLTDSMLAEQISNAAVEATFLYHTQKERHNLNNLNGFKNADILSMIKGTRGDFQKFQIELSKFGAKSESGYSWMADFDDSKCAGDEK